MPDALLQHNRSGSTDWQGHRTLIPCGIGLAETRAIWGQLRVHIDRTEDPESGWGIGICRLCSSTVEGTTHLRGHDSKERMPRETSWPWKGRVLLLLVCISHHSSHTELCCCSDTPGMLPPAKCTWLVVHSFWNTFSHRKPQGSHPYQFQVLAQLAMSPMQTIPSTYPYLSFSGILNLSHPVILFF
jgi:hypothetical protein